MVFFVFLAIQTKNIYAQDTLILISGKKYQIETFALHDSTQTLTVVLKNDKKRAFSMDEVLMVKKADETVFEIYKPTAGEMQFTFTQMRNYVEGEVYARNNHSAIAGLLGCFVVGTASPYIIKRNTYPVPVFFCSLGYSWILPKKHYGRLSNEYFIAGYKDAARKKRLLMSLAGGIGGLITGTAVYRISHPGR